MKYELCKSSELSNFSSLATKNVGLKKVLIEFWSSGFHFPSCEIPSAKVRPQYL